MYRYDSPKQRVPDFPDRFGEYVEHSAVGENGGASNLRFRRFVFCKLRNVMGRMGLGFGFDPYRGHYSANLRRRKRAGVCSFTHSVTN